MHFGGDPPLFSKPKNWNAGSSGNLAAATAGQPPRPPLLHPYGGTGSSSVGAEAACDTLHVHNPLAQAGPSFGSLSVGNSFSSAGAAGTKPVATAEGPAANVATAGGFESVWAAMMAASGAQEQQQPVLQQQPPMAQPQPPKENTSAKLAAAFHTAALAALNKRLHASLTAVMQQTAGQAKAQLELQGTLRQRGEQLQSEVATLQVCRMVSCLPRVSFRHAAAVLLLLLLSFYVVQAERVALDKLSQELAASSAHLDRSANAHVHCIAAPQVLAAFLAHLCH